MREIIKSTPKTDGYRMPAEVRVVEMSSNDSWMRDCGSTFVINDREGISGIDWQFNAWGGLVDGLYFPWDKDNLVASKVCRLERIDSLTTTIKRTEGNR